MRHARITLFGDYCPDFGKHRAQNRAANDLVTTQIGVLREFDVSADVDGAAEADRLVGRESKLLVGIECDPVVEVFAAESAVNMLISDSEEDDRVRLCDGLAAVQNEHIFRLDKEEKAVLGAGIVVICIVLAMPPVILDSVNFYHIAPPCQFIYSYYNPTRRNLQ